jgi:transcriptional regulator GlxA family with amidase domain
MTVGVLVRDPVGRARIQDALRGFARVALCEREADLLTMLGNATVSVIVVEPRDRTGTPTIPFVRAMREQFPNVPVVAYCAITPYTSSDVLALARAGVNDLILRDIDDERVALRSALDAAHEHCLAERALEALTPAVPPSVLPFLTFCLQNAARPLTVGEAARALGVHRKTLVDRLTAAGLPSPSAIISWCRLLAASRLLEDAGRPVEQVALLLDFPSGASLRNMLKRYTGLRPAEIRENGGVACALHIMRQSLSPSVATQSW